MGLPKLLLASNTGLLGPSVAEQLQQNGFELWQATRSGLTASKNQNGTKALEPPLPAWPCQLNATTQRHEYPVPEAWQTALTQVQILIYSPEPAEEWSHLAPQYTELTWPAMALQAAACESRLSRIIYLDAGPVQGYTLHEVQQEWDGVTISETHDDPYEFQRAVQFERACFHHWSWWLSQPLKKSFFLWPAEPPKRTELIWVRPDYGLDSGFIPDFDPLFTHPACQIRRYSGDASGNVQMKASVWSQISLVKALERLCREPFL